MHAWGKVTVAVVIGAFFGMLSSASNQVETPLAFILNAGWAWAGAMVLAGWIATTPPLGAATGVLAGMAAVLAYYGADSVLRGEPFTDYRSEITYWAIAIVVMGPGLGAIGAALRGRGLTALLAGLVIPIGAAVEMIWLPRWPDGDPSLNLTIARVAVWAMAAICGAVSVRRYLRGRGVALPRPQEIDL